MKTVQVWCQTDVGHKRTNNEDSFLMDPDLGLYIVADGMGGHSGGEVASKMAVQTVREIIIESFEKDAGIKPIDLLYRAYAVTSAKIYDMSLSNPELKGMGTTLVVALIRDQKIYFANVGDSRAYLLTASGMWQMTEDHSLVYEQIKAGVLNEENKSQFAKNIITRSVGFEKVTACDIIERTLQSTDKFVICSDGLTGMVEDREIYKIAMENDPQNVVSNLINEAKRAGGLDNVTVMFMNVVDG